MALRKLTAGVAPVVVIGAHEEVGSTKVEARSENTSFPFGALGQRQKLALPVD
jgi:hypothetical protein